MDNQECPLIRSLIRSLVPSGRRAVPWPRRATESGQNGNPPGRRTGQPAEKLDVTFSASHLFGLRCAVECEFRTSGGRRYHHVALTKGAAREDTLDDDPCARRSRHIVVVGLC